MIEDASLTFSPGGLSIFTDILYLRRADEVNLMKFYRHDLETCSTVTGVAVVIDVLRAFTTAAFALNSGVREIILTDTVKNAFLLQKEIPESLIVGEVDGYPVEGFDFSNSPLAFGSRRLNDRILIQRTTAGTQGVVRCIAASEILVSSFVCARATAIALQQEGYTSISFIITGGDEDAACADYIEALFADADIAPQQFLGRVKSSAHGKRFVESSDGVFPVEDLHACCEVNRFEFAMKVQRRNDLHILREHRLSYDF